MNIKLIKLGSLEEDNTEAFNTDTEDNSRDNLLATVNAIFAVPKILRKKRAAGEDQLLTVKTQYSGEYYLIYL